MPGWILIVEDDEELHELYEIMLADLDYDLVRAYDGTEALEQLQDVSPDLILLDMLLDEMMGDEFLTEMRHDPQCANIPVVIASVLPLEECGHLVDTDPHVAFLQKPFRKEALLTLVQRQLRKDG
jgi:twitching motility two-component system response regulator PilH